MCHNTTVMGKTKAPLLLSQERILETVGTNIKLARLRRDLSTEQVAERAGIGRSTLVKVEKGDGGVALATYLKVLFVLGLEGDIKAYSRRRCDGLSPAGCQIDNQRKSK